MKRLASLLCLSLLLVAAGPTTARAQEAVPAGADVTLFPATRTAVVESLIAVVNERYVLPDVAREVARALRRHKARGDYQRITSARALADTLTAHLHTVAHDLHLGVHFSLGSPMLMSCGAPSPAEVEEAQAMARLRNFGFERLQRLPGNVGYLDLRLFDMLETGAGDVAAAAMGFLAQSDALIIDLRRNGGGSGDMVKLLITYLLEPQQRLHFFDFYIRKGDEVEVMQDWTLPFVPGPRLAGKDVYVLTSRFTGSAAESYAYAVQAENLATLVGERTAGAGNLAGALVPLPGGFSAMVPPARVESPTTKAGWEGVGVSPDIEVGAEMAVREAHVRAVKALLKRATREADRDRLQIALEAAEQTPPDPIEPPAGLRVVKIRKPGQAEGAPAGALRSAQEDS